jgi:hypothetical protein
VMTVWEYGACTSLATLTSSPSSTGSNGAPFYRSATSRTTPPLSRRYLAMWRAASPSARLGHRRQRPLCSNAAISKEPTIGALLLRCPPPPFLILYPP